MDLRSSRHENDYNELQTTLSGMGFYEEGMELQEMRQILDALKMSVTERETNFLECDIEQAIRESELDFMPCLNDRVLNSTMRSNINPNISTCSSPEIPSEKIVVQADVHHDMNWSPLNERLLRKRFASNIITNCNANISPDELLEPNPKRFPEKYSPIAINKHQEVSNMLEESTHNSITDINNNIVNSLQASTSSLHEVRGPISMRRVHDSGLNMTTEMPHSSFNSSKNSNVCNNFLASSNNLSVNSNCNLCNSIHVVCGPVSARRIHDSGLNISGATVATHSSSLVNDLNEGANCLENSVQISDGSTAYSYAFENDSEP